MSLPSRPRGLQCGKQGKGLPMAQLDSQFATGPKKTQEFWTCE